MSTLEPYDVMIPGRFGARPLRYVPCKCRNCGYNLRVIVARGGRPLTVSEVWRDHGAWARGLNNAGLDRRDPVWSAMGVVESAWPSTMTACGVCSAVFTVSPSAWWRGPRTPTPSLSTAHKPGQIALSDPRGVGT